MMMACCYEWSFSLKLDGEWSFHGDVEVVVGVVIQNKGFFNVSTLLLLVDINHSVQVLNNEHIVLNQILLQFISTLKRVAPI